MTPSTAPGKPTPVPHTPPSAPAASGASGGGGGFYTTFRHYLSGNVFDARDYGHKAWPIGKGG
jgi:hypothetical protein